jgi:EAL domain-containing protein (putative c-di-GMP-specific phosphodiesterase class I)
MAMYVGKETNTRIQLFDPAIGKRVSERHLMERAMSEAVKSSALSLVFQPIINAHSGVCEIAEALVRWRHPQFGLMLPAKFIPMAERTGEITAIGRWVLFASCREAVTWHSSPPVAVSVNISALQINTGHLVADVRQALTESGLAPARLHLELTESVFAGDISVINPILRSLREMGVRISLDDFGTGFSCLSYLRTLPIDMIKIDRSFVLTLAANSKPIIRTIVTTAQAFGLKTVAEGVETESQALSLVEMEADYLQGFLFSHGLDSARIREWLAQQYASRLNTFSAPAG